MNKRLMKRHKRQVTRARERVKLSEPDVRTPEQVRAAREASRPSSPHTTALKNSTPASAAVTATVITPESTAA